MEDHKKEPEMEAKSESVTIELPTEMELTIRGIQYIVTAHYDDTQEDLPTKVARLLKKECYLTQKTSPKRGKKKRRK